MSWDDVVQRVSPHVVRIDTPDGSGTGFLCRYNQDRSTVAIATAAHVISHAHEWQQPIRISSKASRESRLLGSDDRAILPAPETDSAVILINHNLGLTEDPIPLLPDDRTLSIGSTIGWLGFPGIARNTLCFFRGAVSAIESVPSGAPDSYLIDGVAINGVSGGPVIYVDSGTGGDIYIVGTLSAYWPNRQDGESLPGLSIAQRISHVHEVVQGLEDIEEAQRKQEEMEAQQEKEAEELLKNLLL